MIRTLPLAAFLLAAFLPAAAAAGDPHRAETPQALATLFSDGDYPAAAIRAHEQGTVAFRLEVGADGNPTGCSVVSSSGSQALDSTTCRLLMERARFRPARDAGGKAVTDEYVGRIVWRLPDDAAAPTRLQALQMLWNFCVMGEAAKLAPGDLPADEIARRSFAPCAALEALVARDLKATAPLDGQRDSMKRTIGEFLATLREQMKAAP
jgi:TonB family protein